jgi:4-hydroxythreonine-4-phosphate dehydrogenase
MAYLSNHPFVIGVVNLQNVPDDLPWGIVSQEAGEASFAYVATAVQLAQSGVVDAICTAPIHKKSWELAQVPFPGHTEALAKLSGANNYAMMLKNQRLRVTHCTTHIAFRDIVNRLTPERVVIVSQLAHQYLQSIGIEKPRIAVSALNPHAGDDGLFGDEEDAILRPALDQLRQQNLEVSGPWPADTIFARAQTGEFDMVVALYHDQGHIAIKMLGIDTGVNQTIGLPIIRTSVDHGTAFEIAGKGVAHETSMVYALRAASDDARVQAQRRCRP